jgi:hypothetical protein
MEFIMLTTMIKRKHKKTRVRFGLYFYNGGETALRIQSIRLQAGFRVHNRFKIRSEIVI